MPNFKYKAYTTDGFHEEGMLSAISQNDAVRQLASQDLKPYKMELAKGDAVFSVNSTPNQSKKIKLNNSECAIFFNGMSILLNSGFELDDTLATTEKIATSNKIKKSYQRIRGDTQTGETLSHSLKNNLQLPEFATAIIASSEQGGELKFAVERLATLFQQKERARSEILSAVTYPIFLLCLLIIILVLLALHLVPALAPLFTDGNTELPLLLGMLLSFGEFLNRYGLVLTITAIASSSVLLHPRSRAKLRVVTTSFGRKLPWLGDYLRQSMNGHYLRTLATLTAANIPLPQAMSLSAHSIQLPNDRSQFLVAQRQRVEGRKLSEALTETRLLDNYVVSLLAIGEKSNALSSMVERSAQIVETNTQTQLDKFLGALSPALTILIGLLVGSLVISVMTALLSLNEAVLQ